MIECLRLRIQDVDFEYLKLLIRSGNGHKDRHAVLPEKLIPSMEQQMLKRGGNAVRSPSVV
jgi:integrase